LESRTDSAIPRGASQQETAPHVAGLAALFLSHFPNYGASQVRQIIGATADDVNSSTDPGRDVYIGWGRINAYKALTSLKSGIITSNEDWSDLVVVTGDVTIPSDVTVTIEPGTSVRSLADFDAEASGADPSRCELIVQGTLIAEGTASQPIVFASARDVPQLGDWYGIRFLSSSEDSACVLKNCQIYYAHMGVYCDSASPEISTNEITSCTYGVVCENQASPEIVHNKLHEISSCGIYSLAGCEPSVVSDTLIGKRYSESRGIYSCNSNLQIQGGLVENYECGISCCGGEPVISGVRVSNNSVYGIACNLPASAPSEGDCGSSSPTIINNIINIDF